MECGTSRLQELGAVLIKTTTEEEMKYRGVGCGKLWEALHFQPALLDSDRRGYFSTWLILWKHFCKTEIPRHSLLSHICQVYKSTNIFSSPTFSRHFAHGFSVSSWSNFVLRTCISSSHLQHVVLQLLPLVCWNQNGKQCLKGVLIVTALWSNGPVLVRSFEDIHHNLQNLRLKVRQEICQPIGFTWFYLSSAPSAETA